MFQHTSRQVEVAVGQSYSLQVALYIARTARECRNYFAVTIAKPNGSGYQFIHGRCTTCGYEISWALITS
jgi:hypothetical protein